MCRSHGDSESENSVILLEKDYKEKYKEYILSKEWGEKRKLAFKIFGKKCQKTLDPVPEKSSSLVAKGLIKKGFLTFWGFWTFGGVGQGYPEK